MKMYINKKDYTKVRQRKEVNKLQMYINIHVYPCQASWLVCKELILGLLTKNHSYTCTVHGTWYMVLIACSSLNIK